MENPFKGYAKSVLVAGLAAMTLLASSCSDDDHHNARTESSKTGLITVQANQPVTANVAAPEGVVLKLAGATLMDGGTPPVAVFGNISTTVKRSERVSDLPPAAQTLPAGGVLAVLIDVSMKNVKTITPPMEATVTVPGGVTSVDIYSFNGTTSSWVLEQPNVAVTNGKATFDIGHLSIWACIKKITTGGTTPNAFTFSNMTGVQPGSTVTSAPITVSGITLPSPISVTGGTYSIGSGAFTSAAGTVTNGQTVRVQHTASASNSTATSTVLTIGGVSATFTSTTATTTGGTTPNAFTFSNMAGVQPGSTVTSAPITVSGITLPSPISVTGGTYSIGSGAFTSAAGTVTNGQTVRVQHTASASNSTATSTVLTIGGVSATFTSTTVASGSGSGVNAAQRYQALCAGCHRLGTVDTTGFAPDLLGANVSSRFPTPGAPGIGSHTGITLTADEISALTAYFLAPM